MVNSAVQAVLNATDTWFIGRVSPAATAAIGAVYWPVLVFGLLFGGVGLAVQTLVAQAYGARRYARASQATWTALWASLFTVPLFVVLQSAGSRIFAPFGIARRNSAARAGRIGFRACWAARWASPCGRFSASSTASAGPTVTLRIALGRRRGRMRC